MRGQGIKYKTSHRKHTWVNKQPFFRPQILSLTVTRLFFSWRPSHRWSKKKPLKVIQQSMNLNPQFLSTTTCIFSRLWLTLMSHFYWEWWATSVHDGRRQGLRSKKLCWRETKKKSNFLSRILPFLWLLPPLSLFQFFSFPHFFSSLSLPHLNLLAENVHYFSLSFIIISISCGEI